MNVVIYYWGRPRSSMPCTQRNWTVGIMAFKVVFLTPLLSFRSTGRVVVVVDDESHTLW